MNKLHEN